MSGEVVALPEARSPWVVGVIYSDRVAAVFPHNCETGDIGRTVSNVNHVRKRHRTNIVWHMVIDVLRHVEQPLVDTKQVLGFLRVADDAFGKSDLSRGILRVLAAENLPQIWAEPATFDEDLKS